MTTKKNIRGLIEAIKDDCRLTREMKISLLSKVNYYIGGVTEEDRNELYDDYS